MNVNGTPRPIFRANLASKAVRLDRGVNRVEFAFALPLMSTLQAIVGLGSFACIVAVGVAATTIVSAGLREATSMRTVGRWLRPPS